LSTRPNLTLVIPAFNEVGRIGTTVTKVCEYLDRQPYAWELIVVIDGGSAQAGVEARRAAQAHPTVRVVENDINRGKGYSVRRGFQAAQGARLVFIDADLSLPIAGLQPMMARFDAGADVVIGSRMAAGAEERGTQPALRRVMSRVFNGVVQRVVLPGLADTQCGFKGFTAEAASAIFAAQTIDRFGFDVEVLFLARKHGYRIDELPVECTYHPGSSVSRVGDVSRMLLDLWRIRRRHG
jgi:dolichyl-phosphate beta-glucosyltransferase